MAKKIISGIISFLLFILIPSYILLDSYKDLIEPNYINSFISNITQKLIESDINKSIEDYFNKVINTQLDNNFDLILKYLIASCKENIKINYKDIEIKLNCNELEQVTNYNDLVYLIKEKIEKTYNYELSYKETDKIVKSYLHNLITEKYSSKIKETIDSATKNFTQKLLLEIQKIDCKIDKFKLNLTCIRENPQYLVNKNFREFLIEINTYLFYGIILLIGLGIVINKKITPIITTILISLLSLLPFFIFKTHIENSIIEALEESNLAKVKLDLLNFIDKFFYNIKSKIFYPIIALLIINLALYLTGKLLKINI